MELSLKHWHNRRHPYWRVCLHRWCWRFQDYNHRCYLHVRETL